MLLFLVGRSTEYLGPHLVDCDFVLLGVNKQTEEADSPKPQPKLQQDVQQYVDEIAHLKSELQKAIQNNAITQELLSSQKSKSREDSQAILLLEGDI